MAELECVCGRHAFSCAGIMLFPPPASCFAGSRDFVGVECSQHVEDSGGSEQASTVVAVGVRNVGAVGLQSLGYKVKDARTQVGNIAELGKSVFTVTRKNIAAHARAKNDENCHGGKTDQCSPPHFQEGVAEAGEEPCCCGDG